jgi:hypothetical protein
MPTETNRASADNAEHEEGPPKDEVLPFDFVDFLCALRGIERDAALMLLSEFVLGFRPRAVEPSFSSAGESTTLDPREHSRRG